MDDLIGSYVDQFRQIIQRVVPDSNLTSLAIGVFATVLVTVVFFISRALLRFIAAKFQSRIRSWQGTRIRAFTVQNQDILSDAEIVKILSGSVTALYYFVLLVLLSIYLNLLFAVLPWTRGWATFLLTSVAETLWFVADAVIGYIPKLIFVVIIFGLTTYLIKLARLIFDGIAQGRIKLHGFYPEWSSPTFNIIRLLIVAFALVLVFPYLPGSGSPAFQGVSIFLGVLFSLGSTAAVANIVAGVVITYTRAFQFGDRVKIADTVGDVIEKTLFVTRVRTPKNVEIAIPNSMVLANHIINFSSLSQEPGLVLHTVVTIGYDAPWRRVEQLLVAAAKKTDRVKDRPEPFVIQKSLDDFYVSYELNCFTQHPHEMADIYSQLHQNIQDCFHEAGIEITSPHFSAIRDANRVTIQDDYLPKDYEPPAFRIHPFEQFVSRDPKKGP